MFNATFTSGAGLRPSACAALLLTAHALLLAWGATVQSPISDEAASMVAGLRIWQTGRFDLYRVNPPLVRIIATAPVALAQPSVDWSSLPILDSVRTEHALGAQFSRLYGERALLWLTLARWTCIPFSVLGGWICFCWARALYGNASGTIALLLWCCSPNILAHGQLITTDAAAAALGVLAGYTFWRWCRTPSWLRALEAGFCLGLAQLTKSTWIVAYMVLPGIWAIAWLGPRVRVSKGHSAVRAARQLGSMLALSLLVLNLGYLAKGSCRRLGEFTFVSRSLAASNSKTVGRRGGNRFAESPLSAIPIPLPSQYVAGMDWQKHELEKESWSYLRGQWRRQGWWYYYLYGLLVKVPLGVWGLLLIAVRSRTKQPLLDELTLLGTPAAILILVSAQTAMNHHLRYVLPALPFVFIWASRVGKELALGEANSGAANGREVTPRQANTPGPRQRRWIICACLAWSPASSLMVFPHHLSYFNEVAGGPANGAAHLLGSNLDWGQDQRLLKRWIDRNCPPGATPMGLACLTRYFDPKLLRVRRRRIPPGDNRAGSKLDRQRIGPRPGWFAVRMNRLWSRNQRLTYFRKFQPVARAGYSINIYQISRAEANRVRRELGLPPLADTDSDQSFNKRR